MDDVTRDLRAKVLAEAANAPAPTRTMESRRRLVLLAVAAACVGSVAFMKGVPTFSATRTQGYVLVSALGAGAVGLLAGAWFLRRARRSVGAFGEGLPGFAALVTVAVLAVSFAAFSFVPASAAAEVWGLSSHVACLLAYGALSTALLVCGLVAFRGTDPVMPGLRGLGLAAVVTACATCALAVHFARVDLTHVLASHVGPAPAVLLLGALLGRRFLGVRLRS